ncbi:MAG TPA: tyrosine-type recombinase/integrase [Kofleriaceae bacterium]|jgi:site-specific recombinase XerD|nr:tyrosine-type recombinase/integrase [Kofleriaceae bacterium]
MSLLAPTLQAFFTDRLIGQKRASAHTIAAYRDTLRLLLAFAAEHTAKPPSDLDIDDIDAPLIGAFLDHLEHERGNTIRTRNARLAAIRSLFRYAALRQPEHAATIQHVLAIPSKRHDQALVTFLTDHELNALLDAPDQSTWIGRRDHALILLAAQTGLRASELIGLTCGHLRLGTGAHVSCIGKGRKQRITPLTKQTVAVMRDWTRERDAQPDDPLFATSTGRKLTRDALERRLTKHAATAAATCPSLAAKAITPHVLRHTAAMRLLHADVETTVIALWLGHEQIQTTQIYLHADLAIKQKALDRTTPPTVKPGRYQPTDRVLAFLDAL